MAFTCQNDVLPLSDVASFEFWCEPIDRSRLVALSTRKLSLPANQDGQELQGKVPKILLFVETGEGEEEGSTPENIGSLSQKYRPMFFEELIGQNIVVQSLMSAISRERIAPVYLFQGPRGTGKTSTARIFAAALNCLATEETKPCGVCKECADFISGKVRDLREVDSSSKKGIDTVWHILKKKSRWLRKISSVENLDVESDALDLIALSADGSLRDAETMLDQLSLLGKRIKTSLVNELVGVVSDEKLLELLELTMPSETTETVKKSQRVDGLGVDLMVVMSQLATLIMDIIARTYQS
ncbi:protein STICHEL-like [Actinidia eriantha]|uniref:protein STICHEL-like n=1 Tax=Actinidia eriantha TaxID=165200 RepID=UPI00258F5D6E|nr:protein STICHEL-like [Actinidia eriantha]